MNRGNRWFLVGILAAGIGLWPVAGAFAADDRDACAMLHKVDVEAAFAPRKFDSGKPGFAMKASKSRAAVSNCTYTSKDATVKEMVTLTLVCGVRRVTQQAPPLKPPRQALSN